jgi:ABC-type transporter Mla subunit MlaD
MEKIVGWFILAATALMFLALGYYLYRTAEQRGWFEVKAPYSTYSDTGAGLAVGDPVLLMGFPIGRVTGIVPMPPRGKGSDHDVLIQFLVVGTNYSYIWTGNSRAKFVDSGFLGKRQLDVTKGTTGYGTYVNFPAAQMSLADIKSSPRLDKLRLGEEVYSGTNLQIKAWVGLATNLDKLASLGLSRVWTLDAAARSKNITAVWNDAEHHYEPFAGTNIYVLPPDEPPALMDRVQAIVAQVEEALPNFLSLTNQLAATLSNSERLTSNLNAVAAGIRPAAADVAAITANLRDPRGSLGEWLIPTNLNRDLAATLINANLAITNANGTLTNVNTNLLMVFEGLGRSLDNAADITSNLNYQVQANSNVLSDISQIITNTDDFIEGLKRHWFLRSAFKPAKTNAPSPPPPPRR